MMGEEQAVKISVRKGRTYSLRQYESLRVDYSVEDSVPRSDALAVMAAWEQKIDRMLEANAPKASESGNREEKSR
jgi:hypothetical protein